MSVIANSVLPTAEEIIHVLDQVKSRLISHLINGISRVRRKLLKYFNGTAINVFCITSSRGFSCFLFPVFHFSLVFE